MPTSQHEPSCFHCGLPAPDPALRAVVADESRDFCCPGCRAVCGAIHAAGLEGFYARTPDGRPLAPPPEQAEDPAVFDLADVQAEFVRPRESLLEAELLVEGIHCAACAWLIERHLGRRPGVDRVQVNLASRRLTLRWNPAETALSSLLEALAGIGYAALPFDADAVEGRLQRTQRARLYRLAFAGFAMMNLLWISIALYTGADRGEHRDLLHWAGWALATPTLLYAGWPFLRGAWSGLRHGHPTMDLPIAIGALATYLYSTWAMVAGGNEAGVYFDTVVNFLFVILVGRHLEGLSRRQAMSATHRLLELQPRVATRLGEDGEQRVSVRSLRAGERVRVRPGERLPVDGRIVEGETAVDESLLSGESAPRTRLPGERLYAGTRNLDGSVVLEVEQTLADTALGRIARLVEAAQDRKAPVQRLADRIVPWFVVATLGLAALTFAAWFGRGIEPALMAAVAVLIVTCPCAFGLATPMAIAVAAGAGARRGILVKSGVALEALAGADHVVFDKTGTLTRGRQEVVACRWRGIEPVEGLGAVAALECRSEHGIGAALVGYATRHGVADGGPAVADFRARPGRGVVGTVGGRRWLVGSPSWIEAEGVTPEPGWSASCREHEARGESVVMAAVDGAVVGLFALADRLREDAARVVAELRRAGIGVTLLSGDREGVARAVAGELGIESVVAGVLPEGKASAIAGLQRAGHRVAMVGDGVNDAPALARADIGIALGSGTDVSVDCAGIVLGHDRLGQLTEARGLAASTLRTVRQNIGLSIAYNLVMVPLAMSGLVTPLLAALTMPLSSLAVIGNAARLRRGLPTDEPESAPHGPSVEPALVSRGGGAEAVPWR
ncbi:MAG: heavy metal translocating P-type ATPase [Gammaproteobacteria bacterium]|nr:heavy metal translocating P-type ATPase [Gammaproteobacteria bacterium]